MMSAMQLDHRKNPRRRGEVLEEAIMRAALDELAEVGYASLGMERIAARARTSKAALYRRWPGRAELVIDAYVRFVVVDIETPDTGSLRTDVLSLMSQVVDRMTSPMVQMLHGLLAEAKDDTDLVRVIRENIVRLRPAMMADILARAGARGELRREPLTQRQITLPIDLLRAEFIGHPMPIPYATLEAMVDEIFLPLVQR